MGGKAEVKKWKGLFGRRPNLDKSKVDELYTLSSSAYDVELIGSSKAFDLHTSAISQWSASADTARTLSTTEQLFRTMALRKYDLHKQRLNTLQLFIKQGKPLTEVRDYQSSDWLIRNGYFGRAGLYTIRTAGERLEETMPLTQVGFPLLYRSRQY